ncbi:MAG: ABC transporter permease subunit [Promethearchaeia archaeon]
MKKDMKVILRNKQISIPLIILPLIFTIGLPIFTMLGVIYDPEAFVSAFGDIDQLKAQIYIPEEYNMYLSAAMIMSKMMILPYFLMIPTLICVIISSDSFAGEKERKTMETLALLPISKMELILGKVFTSFIPGFLLSVILFGVEGIIMNFMFLEYLEGNILLYTDVTWLLSVFLLIPALSLFNVLVSTMVSSRSKDFKSAQSITGALIVPVMILLFLQIFNPAFLSPLVSVIITVILLLLDIALAYWAKSVLDIEKLILMM